MATTFENENPHGRSLTTSVELNSFWDKMKHTVVIVQVSIPQTSEQLASGVQGYRRGTGVVFDEYGYIITCWHTFESLTDEALKGLEIQYWNEPFVKARLILRAPNLDCAILKPSDAVKNSRPFATFVSPSAIKFGVQTLTIGHPGRLENTIAVGAIAHPNRSMADIVEILEEEEEEEEAVQFKDRDRHMILVQLNNIHGGPGQSGGPVFTNTGLIIGLSLYSYLEFIFASHSADLRRLAKIAKSKVTSFWSAEVLPGQTLLCHPGSPVKLHITQACLGVINTAEAVSLSITTKSEKYLLATLSGDKFPQVKLNLVLDSDFELAHSSRTSSVFVFGNKFKGKRRSGDSDEDEEGTSQANPKYVSNEEDGTVLVNFHRKKGGGQSFFNHMINRMIGKK